MGNVISKGIPQRLERSTITMKARHSTITMEGSLEQQHFLLETNLLNQGSSLRKKRAVSISFLLCNNFKFMEVLDGASSHSCGTFRTGYSSYDVFLSFRGEDTRNNFTSFLNLTLKDKGINVFIDSENLRNGEAIGPSLLRAIDASKISIPVFSQGYANSKWCLLELAQILQCHISNCQLVLPVFFYVDPSHVRNQTGSFEEAFREHEKNFEPHIVESWRKAMTIVGSLKGDVINKNT
ncbi:disease resistance protein L6-like [Macadamia integrifolia]|uniref:disease resistance protein L6-like n=1 Tax=Macadamia integrifolia TaxID=60698 RepID=UPI001C4EB877|nr:disease resistance protein L6-like [Macadamia integrifolia]